MSDSTYYKMTMTGEGFDPEFIIFQMFKAIPEADSYIDAEGKSTGNGYDWRSLEEDMRKFSAKKPNVTFFITEYGSYDSESFEYRHYFRDGKYALIEPEVVTTWTEFTDDLLE